jgi:hypothetical protein
MDTKTTSSDKKDKKQYEPPVLTPYGAVQNMVLTAAAENTTMHTVATAGPTV